MNESWFVALMCAATLAGVAMFGFGCYIAGKNEVVSTCRTYNRYYVEARGDEDPMGYYLNCYVTTGPEIDPNSKEGKKK